MDDDFNTAAALGIVFEGVKAINTFLKENDGSGQKALERAERFLRTIDSILGIIGVEEDDLHGDEEEIVALLKERETARRERKFSRSDEIRDSLAARGILLEDTPQGTKWKRRG